MWKPGNIMVPKVPEDIDERLRLAAAEYGAEVMEHDWKDQGRRRRPRERQITPPFLYKCDRCGAWNGVGRCGFTTVVADPPKNCCEGPLYVVPKEGP